MKTIKTAISIDTKTFSEVSRLTKKLHISRSSFFTQAAQYMVEKNENLELLQKINAVYEQQNSYGNDLKTEKAYAKKKIIEKW